jgi:hypothetical protein
MKKLITLLFVPLMLSGAFLVGCEPVDDGGFPQDQPAPQDPAPQDQPAPQDAPAN